MHSREAMSQEKPVPSQIRCAIYTRTATEDGSGLESNSLDTQREAAEAFVAGQKDEGWICLPNRYDDRAFSGNDAKRPGLARLLTDVEDGQIDCVVVNAEDRLSRSLLDFARIMETFESHNVLFVVCATA